MGERSASSLCDEGVIRLVAAVVRLAAEDWRLACLGGHLDRIKEVERFFLSRYFEDLTGLDGREVLQMLCDDFAREYGQRPASGSQAGGKGGKKWGSFYAREEKNRKQRGTGTP